MMRLYACLLGLLAATLVHADPPREVAVPKDAKQSFAAHGWEVSTETRAVAVPDQPFRAMGRLNDGKPLTVAKYTHYLGKLGSGRGRVVYSDVQVVHILSVRPDGSALAALGHDKLLWIGSSEVCVTPDDAVTVKLPDHQQTLLYFVATHNGFVAQGVDGDKVTMYYVPMRGPAPSVDKRVELTPTQQQHSKFIASDHWVGWDMHVFNTKTQTTHKLPVPEDEARILRLDGDIAVVQHVDLKRGQRDTQLLTFDLPSMKQLSAYPIHYQAELLTTHEGVGYVATFDNGFYPEKGNCILVAVDLLQQRQLLHRQRVGHDLNNAQEVRYTPTGFYTVAVNKTHVDWVKR